MYFNDLNKYRTVGITLKISRRKLVRPWEKNEVNKIDFILYVQDLYSVFTRFDGEFWPWD